MENVAVKPETDKPVTLNVTNIAPSPSTPNIPPEVIKFSDIPNRNGNGITNTETPVDIKPKLSATTITPSTVTTGTGPNSLSKLLNTPGAPSVIRPQPRPLARPQPRPQASTFLTNIASRNPVDYSLYRSNSTFPNLVNGNLSQLQALPSGFNNYSNLRPQLGNIQASIAPQIRPASGRPNIGRIDTSMYSISPNTQPLTYRPQVRPQYTAQNLNSSPQVRPRGASTRPGYISSPAISMAGAPAVTPARAAVPNEKVFSLLFSQLSTSNQILLGECLTKLKNKVMTWDEFHKRTLEIFGNKHSAFIQAIGADNPRPANTPQSSQTVAAPRPAPVPVTAPVSTPVSYTSNLSGQAAPPSGNRAPLWNPGSNQNASGTTLTNSLPTLGISRPQVQPQTIIVRPSSITTSNPTSGPSAPRPPLQNESRINGEDNRAVDFDNLTDVMGSAGVDLREESENIMRSVHGSVGLRSNSSLTEVSGLRTLDSFVPLPFVEIPSLNQILLQITKKYDVSEISPEVLELLSLAVEERVRGLLDQMIKTSKHRVLAQQTYPTPPLNDIGKPIYKVMVNKDPRKQLQALERVDKDRVRKYYLRLEEGSQIDEDGESRSKKSKNRRDASSGLTATASARNMSEESRKANANQTTHMFTGGLRKSWMLASTTPRISSPLASAPPTTSRDSKSETNKDSKKPERTDSSLSSVKRHAPAVSSNLVSKTDSGPSSPVTSVIESKPDQSNQFKAPSNPNLLNINRTKTQVSPSLGSSLSSRFAKNRSTTRSLTAQDALFVIESDVSGRPCSSRAKLLMRSYATLK